MLMLHKFVVPYNIACAKLTYLLPGIQMQICPCTGQVSAVGHSHLFLLGFLVCELYTITAADNKT